MKTSQDKYKPVKIDCPYCGKRATFYPSSAHVYSRDFGPIYRCVPCDAHVGCHPHSHRPLGRLADAGLRKAKMAAHRAFDPLWQSGRMRRKEAYRWLADQLGIEPNLCHIGLFDVLQCRAVVDVVDGYFQTCEAK